VHQRTTDVGGIRDTRCPPPPRRACPAPSRAPAATAAAAAAGQGDEPARRAAIRRLRAEEADLREQARRWALPSPSDPGTIGPAHVIFFFTFNKGALDP